MARTLQTPVIREKRRQRLPYGPDHSDSHHPRTWVLCAFLWPLPFRLTSYLHGGTKGCLMALTLQTFIIFARRRYRLSLALTFQTLIIFPVVALTFKTFIPLLSCLLPKNLQLARSSSLAPSSKSGLMKGGAYDAVQCKLAKIPHK